MPAVGVHSVRHQNPVVHQIGDLPAQHMAVDINAASALAGQSIRIGYDGPDERKAMFDKIARALGMPVVEIEGEVACDQEVRQ